MFDPHHAIYLKNSYEYFFASVASQKAAHQLNQLTRNVTVVDFTPSNFKINRMSMRIYGKVNLCSSFAS